MRPPLRYGLPAAALCLVGLCILGGVAFQVYDGSSPEYEHTVVRISAEEVPEEEPVRGLGSFSDPAREAFVAAVNSDGSHETTTPAPGLVYQSDVVSPENTYIVRYDGSLYMMTTLSGGPGAGLKAVVWVTVGIPLGLCVLIAGAYGLRAERPTYTIGALLGLTAGAVFYAMPETRPGGYTPLWIVLTLVILPWLPLRYLEHERSDEST